MDTNLPSILYRVYSVQFILFKKCISKDIISAKIRCNIIRIPVVIRVFNSWDYLPWIIRNLTFWFQKNSPLNHPLNVTDSGPQSWKKLVGQIKETKLNWTGTRTLISISAYILAATTKALFLRRILRTRLCLQQTLRFIPFKFHP